MNRRFGRRAFDTLITTYIISNTTTIMSKRAAPTTIIQLKYSIEDSHRSSVIFFFLTNYYYDARSSQSEFRQSFYRRVIFVYHSARIFSQKLFNARKPKLMEKSPATD